VGGVSVDVTARIAATAPLSVRAPRTDTLNKD